MAFIGLIFLLIPQEIIFLRIVRPDFLNVLVYITLILNLFEVFYYLQRKTRTCCIVKQLFFSCWPWCILKFGC